MNSMLQSDQSVLQVPLQLAAVDYRYALIHLAWLVVQRQRYLVFGLVELFPFELPAPDATQEEAWHYRDDENAPHRVFVRRFLLPADEALRWYDECRVGRVVMPGETNPPPDKLVATTGLSEDPPWPGLVAANDLPFVSSAWGTVRIHHLLQAGYLTAVTYLKQQDDAMKWLSEHLLFDFCEYREWVGSMHLVAPNPVFRELDRRREIASDGTESTIVRIVPRAGQNLTGLRLHLTEHGPTGIMTIPAVDVTEPTTRIAHRGTVESVGHMVVCPQRGVLDWSNATPYIGAINLDIDMSTGTRTVEVPDTKGRPGKPYTFPIIDNMRSMHVGQPHPNTPMRDIQGVQLARQFRQANEQRAEEWFRDSREEAEKRVRDLIGAARRSVWIIDPYFSAAEYYRFALRVARPNVDVVIVTSAIHLAKDDRAFPGTDAGTVFLEQIGRFRPHLPVTALVMTGRHPAVHGRFLVVDDTVWLSGNSLHTLGERAGMIVKLANSARVIEQLQRIIDSDRVISLEKWTENRQHSTPPRDPIARLVWLAQMRLRGVLPKRWYAWLQHTVAHLTPSFPATDEGEDAKDGDL